MLPYEKFLDGRKTSLSWESFNSDFFCLIRLCWCYRKIHPLSKWVVYNISNEVSWNFKIYKKKKKSLRSVIWKEDNKCFQEWFMHPLLRALFGLSELYGLWEISIFSLSWFQRNKLIMGSFEILLRVNFSHQSHQIPAFLIIEFESWILLFSFFSYSLALVHYSFSFSCVLKLSL